MDWGYVAGYFDGEGTAFVGRIEGSRPNRCSLSWANTHRESLEAIQVFIGCGSVRAHGGNSKPSHYKPSYSLLVSRRLDMMRVANAMLPHVIIKRDKLIELLARIEKRKDQSITWGNLVRAGTEEIRRLYWDEGLNLYEIGERFGVSWSGVKLYMRRHDIPQRTRSEAIRRAKRDSAAWAARSAKIRATRLANWQDPEYRTRMIATTKAAQAKRVAARQASRGTRDRW